MKPGGIINYARKFDYRLWILALGWVASAVGFSLSIPFISIYFHSELGISLTGIGLFFGLAALVRAGFQGVGGELSDRFGRYHLMVTAQIIRSFIFLMMALSVYRGWGFYPVGGLLILNSIFGAFFQPAANATVADLVDRDKRTEAYAITRVAGNFGWALGPAAGGFLAANSYHLLFIFSGAMTMVSSIIIAVFLRGLKPVGVAAGQRSRLRDILSYRGHELIIRHAALLFLLYLVMSQLIAPFSLYAVDFAGITEEQLGFLFTLNGLLVAFLQIPTTRLLSRFRLTVQLSLGAVIYAVAFFWIGATGTFFLFVIGIILVTTGENFVSPPALSITANLAPPGRTGRYMGIYGFSVTFGWSLGPLLGGLLMEWAKPDFIYSWGVIAAIALAAAVGFGCLTKQIPDDLNRYREINK